MTQRLSRDLAHKFVAAAEGGEWLPIGSERDRVKYWLPDRINAGEWLCLLGTRVRSRCSNLTICQHGWLTSFDPLFRILMTNERSG